MIHFHGDGILLDIEGTTSSLRFVHDVLFPYARQNAGEFLKLHWQEGPVQHACAQLMRDADMAQDWPGTQPPADAQRQVLRSRVSPDGRRLEDHRVQRAARHDLGRRLSRGPISIRTYSRTCRKL